MPRPKKCRRVCRFPQNLVFIPKDGDRDRVAVVLTVGEYETLRLIDKEGMSQEQCSEFMQVARGTVQQMYKMPGENWRICWWTVCRCALKGAITGCATETVIHAAA